MKLHQYILHKSQSHILQSTRTQQLIEVAGIREQTATVEAGLGIRHVAFRAVRRVVWIQTSGKNQLFTDDFTFQWVTWQVRE